MWRPEAVEFCHAGDFSKQHVVEYKDSDLVPYGTAPDRTLSKTLPGIPGTA